MWLQLCIAVGVVFGINLMPVFGPPTWAVLVFFRFRYPEIHAVVLIVGGALAAVGGRWLLALTFRRFGEHLPRSRQESLGALGKVIGESRGGFVCKLWVVCGCAVAVAQMFEAAGLARIRLGPLLAAFFVGRLLSYSFYVGTASAAAQPAQPAVQPWHSSPPRRSRLNSQRRPDRVSSLHRLASGDRHCPSAGGPLDGPPAPPSHRLAFISNRIPPNAWNGLGSY